MSTNIKPKSYFYIFLACSFISAGILVYQFSLTSQLQTQTKQKLIQGIKIKNIFPAQAVSLDKKIPDQVRGVYLTAYSAGSEDKISEIIELTKQTNINTVVIDIKNSKGKVFYDSNVELVDELNLEDNRLGDVEQLIDRLHQHNIYVIARQTVFKDSILAERKSEFALKNKQGELWYNKEDLAWVDPSNKKVWRYNVKLAKEAIELGFDEINFDYVRFPTDGNIENIKYSNKTKQKKKYEIMEDFFSFLDKELSSKPALLSVDFFGIVMEGGAEDIIGQRLEDVIDKIDFVSPMMYPSHYPSGHIGLANPGKHPRKIFSHGLKEGASEFKDQQAKVRPWIQAFSLKYDYGKEKINIQTSTIDKYENAGWLLWDPKNTYNFLK
jgi:hypothetical protein